MTETICLIHSGDKSSGIWNYWYYYWRNNYTCKFDTIFLSENLTKNYPGVYFAHTGNVPWAQGLIEYLSRTEAKYIIYMHEDYFLTENTDHEKLDDLIKIVKDNDIQLLKHVGCWAGNPSWNKQGAFVERFDLGEEIYEYSNNQQYLISHQTSIWNKDFLMSTLRPNYTPWCHELEGTSELRKRNIPIYAYRGKNPMEYCETVVHGEVREGQEKYFKINVEGLC